MALESDVKNKGENLFRFLKKTVLKGLYCNLIDKKKDVQYTEIELSRIKGYINILQPIDRILLLNIMAIHNFPDKLLGVFEDEMKFIKKNYKGDKWDFYTKKAFKDEVKKIFKVDETEQG
jgi:hypothetical protein